MQVIEIDGSYLEGGGAILRIATGLSVITQKPIKIFNIRKGRKKSGLQTQHLEGLKAAAKLCNAELRGARLGSTEIEFYPKEITEKRLAINVSTAGSIGLILQVLQLACVFSKHEIEIEVKGGASFGKFAPPIPYLQNITLSMLEKTGYKIELKTIKDGFYPKGGAQAGIKIYPVKNLLPIILEEQGNLETIEGISIASEYLKEREVAERQEKTARKIIFNSLNISPKIKTEYKETLNPGSGIVLWVKTDKTIMGSDSIGELGVRAETVGQNAADNLIKIIKSGATVDNHLADQLIPFIALAGEDSVIKSESLTKHTETNIWLVKKFLSVDFEIKKDKIYEIACKV